MKLKKLLSMILALIMILGAFPVCADGAQNISVYLSVSKYGELVTDKNGDTFACVEIELEGKESYTLDDVFYLAHTLYYEDGEEGYASSDGLWGPGVDKFWGDESYNFAYLINGSYANGTEDIVQNGDYIEFSILTNQYEGYAMFDERRISLNTNNECSLTLEYISGYDNESETNIISPCEGATIIINGEETEYQTDENGEVSLSFENEGRYIVSAKKTRLSGTNEVPVITAPVCVIEVKTPPEIELIHNIAKSYTQTDFTQEDVNLSWIVADMSVYEEIFPESDNILSDEQKEAAMMTIAKALCDAQRPGDLAKGIIALRSLGYDAKNIYTNDFEKVDAVKKLTDMVDLKEESVTNIYTIPYVIIALSQDETYATKEQMDFLVQSVIETKESWQSVEYGTDALTPMLLALAPFCEENQEIEALCNETVEILKSEQRQDGLIDGFEGYESASTGLAICALSALGIDSAAVKALDSDTSLISGLLSTANSEFAGLSNAFATEQGFRGLLSWQLLLENSQKTMYDFSDRSMNEVNMPNVENCPVIFNVTPQSAVVTVNGAEEFSKNSFDLSAGTYSYSASASGYETKIGEFTVSEEEAQNRTKKTIALTLSSSYSGGGISRPPVNNDEEKDEEKEDVEVIKPDISEDKDKTPENAQFTEDTFPDVSADSWYYSCVEYVYENKLFNGTDKGFEPESPMTRAMLVTVLHRLCSSEETADTSLFSDVPNDAWFSKSVAWAAQNNIVNGVEEGVFLPDADITREQLAVILYRFALYSGYDTSAKGADISKFSDREKISPYAQDAINYVVSIGVVTGRDNNLLAPQEKVTRAEVAAMLLRFEKVEK